MLDDGDMILLLKSLLTHAAPTAPIGCFCGSTSVFDAPLYVIGYRASDLSVEYMKQNLHEIESKPCPVAAKAPRVFGLKKRWHRYIYKGIDRLLVLSQYKTRYRHEAILAKSRPVETMRCTTKLFFRSATGFKSCHASLVLSENARNSLNDSQS